MAIPLWERLERFWESGLTRHDYRQFICENGWLWKMNWDWRLIIDDFPEIFDPLESCPLLVSSSESESESSDEMEDSDNRDEVREVLHD